MSKSFQLSASAKYLLGGVLLVASIIAWLVSLRAMTAMPENVHGFVALWTVRTSSLEFKFDGKRSYFRAGEVFEVEFEPIRNLVTGEEHHAAVLLPTGMIAKREDHFSSKTFHVNAAGLNYSYPGRTAIAMQSIWHGP